MAVVLDLIKFWFRKSWQYKHCHVIDLTHWRAVIIMYY